MINKCQKFAFGRSCCPGFDEIIKDNAAKYVAVLLFTSTISCNGESFVELGTTLASLSVGLFEMI